MLPGFIGIWLSAVVLACEVSCRSLEPQAGGRAWIPENHQLAQTNDSEIQKGKLLAESMYLAVKISEIRKKTPMPAMYNTGACFEDLGCFDTRGVMSHVGELPQHPDDISTTFSLYSRRNSERPISIGYNEINKTESRLEFRAAKNIVLLVHGFMENGEADWIINITKKLLVDEDCIVIVVDWSEGAVFPRYSTAVANSALVGRQISLLLQRLMALYPGAVQPKKVHLIGFSLGAHVCGFCGRHFNGETHQMLGRITALDAAGPLFEGYPIHVSGDCASYVDAIHTSGGDSILGGQFGMESPFGHADFYPNGGKSQPGCGFFDLGCSHRRATEYFIESLLVDKTHCRFRSYPCGGGADVLAFIGDSCLNKKVSGEMGYPSYLAGTRGQQFLQTRSHPPYCIKS